MQIASLSNPLVKRIKRLQEKRKYRRKDEAFFVEGYPFVSKAVLCGAAIEIIVYCEALYPGEAERLLITQQKAKSASCVAVSEAVFRHLSQRNNPDGLAAIIGSMRMELDSLAVVPTSVFVALVDMADPGNLGTMLRSIDAVGAAGCILVGRSTDPFHPRTVRASRGSVFTVRLAYAPDIQDVLRWARSHQIHTVATSAKAKRSYWRTSYSFPLLLIMGNEHEGLDAATMDAADQVAGIPMQGVMSSLNVAVATSLMLYEVRRAWLDAEH
jgi:TrmH family RNA methyltransferase